MFDMVQLCLVNLKRLFLTLWYRIPLGRLLLAGGIGVYKGQHIKLVGRARRALNFDRWVAYVCQLHLVAHFDPLAAGELHKELARPGGVVGIDVQFQLATEIFPRERTVIADA